MLNNNRALWNVYLFPIGLCTENTTREAKEDQSNSEYDELSVGGGNIT